MQPIQPQSGRPLINAYGEGGFRINGALYNGPTLVLPSRVVAWADASDFPDKASALFLAGHRSEMDVLLIGSGERMLILPEDVTALLKKVGLPYEVMGTAAACRTYNMLLSDDRLAAAALLPV